MTAQCNHITLQSPSSPTPPPPLGAGSPGPAGGEPRPCRSRLNPPPNPLLLPPGKPAPHVASFFFCYPPHPTHPPEHPHLARPVSRCRLIWHLARPSTHFFLHPAAMHLSSHPRPSIPPPACRHPHALFSAPAGLPRGKPKNPLRSSSICYNPHHPRACRPAKHPSPTSPSCPGPRACLPQPPTFSPCRPPCAPAAALQHPLLPAPHPVAEHQHHWKPHPAPSTYCPPAGRGEPPGHRPAARPTAGTCAHLLIWPGPGTQGPDPSSLPVFLLPRGKSPSPPPPPHFCHPRPSIPPPTCTCSPAATARSPVATHLFVLPALAGDVSFQFIPPLRSVLPTFRQADKPESWKAHHPRRPRRPEPPPAHRQLTASARARPPASPHSPSIHPRSPVTYRSSSSHPRLRLTRRVNRQTLRPLLTSATHPCPARAPGESSTCPRNPPPATPLPPAPAVLLLLPRGRPPPLALALPAG